MSTGNIAESAVKMLSNIEEALKRRAELDARRITRRGRQRAGDAFWQAFGRSLRSTRLNAPRGPLPASAQWKII
jgi:hypothetical protein